MRNYFLFILIITSSTLALAQNSSISSLKNKLEGSEQSVVEYNDIIGSPFRYEEFKKSEVYLKLNDGPIDYILNYDAYKDQMEYIENDVTYAVTNPNQIKKILINNEVFIYTNYYNFDIVKEGYFIEIISDYISLYKKEIISSVSTKSSNYNNRPGQVRFVKAKPTYYISIYGDPLHLIKNKKKLLSLFFNKPEVEDFIKEKKIKLNSEDDLKEFVTFLNDYDKKR